jgi:hypothetical protein
VGANGSCDFHQPHLCQTGVSGLWIESVILYHRHLYWMKLINSFFLDYA